MPNFTHTFTVLPGKTTDLIATPIGVFGGYTTKGDPVSVLAAPTATIPLLANTPYLISLSNPSAVVLTDYPLSLLSRSTGAFIITGNSGALAACRWFEDEHALRIGVTNNKTVNFPADFYDTYSASTVAVRDSVIHASGPGLGLERRWSFQQASSYTGAVATSDTVLQSDVNMTAKRIVGLGWDKTTAVVTLPVTATANRFSVQAATRVTTTQANTTITLSIRVGSARRVITQPLFAAAGTYAIQISGEVSVNPGETINATIASDKSGVTYATRGGSAQDSYFEGRAIVREPFDGVYCGQGSGALREGLSRRLIGTWQARQTWNDIKNMNYYTTANWWTVDRAADIARYDSEEAWRAAPESMYNRVILNVGTSMIPTDSPSGQAAWNGFMDEIIAGTRNTEIISQGRALSDMGLRVVEARYFWEFDQYSGNVDAAKFVAAWNIAVPLLRQGFAERAAEMGKTTQKLYIGWHSIMSLGTFTTKSAYLPDAANVDFVGGDIYWQVYATTDPSLSAMVTAIMSQFDLMTLLCAALGGAKMMSLGEWGNWQAKPANGVADSRGFGDFPLAVDHTADRLIRDGYFASAYFDSGTFGGVALPNTPLTLARLAKKHRYLQPA